MWNRHAFAAGAIVATALLAYGSSVTELGLYYDDWFVRNNFEGAASGKPWDVHSACNDPAGRLLGCVYHSTEYWLFGDSIRPYRAVSVLMVIAMALAGYAVLRRLGWGWPQALGAIVLFVLYPGSDATRLWITAAGASGLVTIYLLGLLCGIEAARSESRRREIWLHVAAAVAFLATALTYEVVVSMIAINGLFYWIASPGRRALRHGAIDLTLALGFAVARLLFSGSSDDGFVQSRDASDWPGRIWDLVSGAWDSWHELMVLGTTGAIAAVTVLAFIAAAIWLRPEARPQIARELLVAGVAVVVALAAVGAYFTANDFYVPDPHTLTNRVNVIAALPYAVAVVALLSAAARAGAALGAARASPAGAVAVAAVLGVSLLSVSRDHVDIYKEAWRAEGAALNGLRAAAPKLPSDAYVVTFGHPIAEKHNIPVFAATWDLRAAIDYETHVDPPEAFPFMYSTACRPDGVAHVRGRRGRAHRLPPAAVLRERCIRRRQEGSLGARVQRHRGAMGPSRVRPHDHRMSRGRGAPNASRSGRGASVHAEQVDHEHQRLVRLDDAPGPARPVGQSGRDRKLAATADAHPLHALVPAGDDLSLAELEAERLSAVP